MRKRLWILLAAALCLLSFAAAGPARAEGTAEGVAVAEDPDFGSVQLGLTAEELGALGFEPGDSCDVAFSNGYRLKDIPYYTGYYVRSGEVLLCAYPGFEYPVIAVSSGSSLWQAAGLTGGDTADITLRAKGKYLPVQEALDLEYSNDRANYPSDAAFANFRAVRAGEIAENRLFRGASPVDDRMGRAETADRLVGEAGIAYVLNLADSARDLAKHRARTGFSAEHYMRLFRAGRVALLDWKMDPGDTAFLSRLGSALREMVKTPGPVYVHCLEGKDRTGVVCILLEALCGASYEEILADYMLTYENYYGVSEASAPERYRAILDVRFAGALEAATGLLPDPVPTPGALRDGARALLRACGLTDTEIDGIAAWLAGAPAEE